MINNNDSIKIARALVELGYNRISTPKSEGLIEIQCNWCLRSAKDNQCSSTTNAIKLRVKHDKGCPVDLAHSL